MRKRVTRWSSPMQARDTPTRSPFTNPPRLTGLFRKLIKAWCLARPRAYRMCINLTANGICWGTTTHALSRTTIRLVPFNKSQLQTLAWLVAHELPPSVRSKASREKVFKSYTPKDIDKWTPRRSRHQSKLKGNFTPQKQIKFSKDVHRSMLMPGQENLMKAAFTKMKSMSSTTSLYPP